MIITCTLNPAIDYHIHHDQINIGHLNRIEKYTFDLGGKGINVSKTLNNLACHSKAITILNPKLKVFYKHIFKMNKYIKPVIVKTKAITRFNVKLHEEEETEINTSSNKISSDEIHKLINEIKKVKTNDMIIFSGSGIKNEPYLYDSILSTIKNIQTDIIIDIPAYLYHQVLKYKPLVIKPNKVELKEFFNLKDDPDSFVPYCKKLIDLGAQSVIVSLGEKGSIFVNKDKAYKISLEPIKTNETIGAGDAFIAGFAYSYQTNKDLIKAYQFGHATSYAYIQNEHLHINDVKMILEKIKLKEIKA